MEVLEEPQLLRHRLTAEEYGRMVESGVLPPDVRVELIDGEVIDMAPMGSRHYSTVARLHRLLERAIQDRGIVVAQAPLRLSAHDEPEPDLVVLEPREDFYVGALPTGTDCLLVIEVSDTTLAYDVRIKAPLYARQGVPEYWVIDLPGQALRRFSTPVGGEWQQITTLKHPGRIALPGLSGAEIDLASLF